MASVKALHLERLRYVFNSCLVHEVSKADLRARSASEIVDAAFALYRQHALQLIVVTAIATAPSIIYALVMSSAPPTTPADLMKQLPVIGVVTAQIARNQTDRGLCVS